MCLSVCCVVLCCYCLDSYSYTKTPTCCTVPFCNRTLLQCVCVSTRATKHCDSVRSVVPLFYPDILPWIVATAAFFLRRYDRRGGFTRCCSSGRAQPIVIRAHSLSRQRRRPGASIASVEMGFLRFYPPNPAFVFVFGGGTVVSLVASTRSRAGWRSILVADRWASAIPAVAAHPK